MNTKAQRALLFRSMIHTEAGYEYPPRVRFELAEELDRSLPASDRDVHPSQGRLVIYHGVKQNAAGAIYSLGLALFDLNDPECCLKRGSEWVFGLEAPYEQHGNVDKLVFPCGYTFGSDGGTLRIYYGVADTSIAMATSSVQAMLQWLEERGKCFFLYQSSSTRRYS